MRGNTLCIIGSTDTWWPPTKGYFIYCCWIPSLRQNFLILEFCCSVCFKFLLRLSFFFLFFYNSDDDNEP